MRAAAAAATDGGQQSGFPLRADLRAGEVTVLTVDWERIVAGTLVLDLDAPAGTRVDVRMCESLTDRGQVPGGGQGHALRYTARGHDDRFESADPAGGRYAVLVLTGAGPVRLRAPVVRERLRPRPEGAWFSCSDPRLEEVHRVGLRTVDLSAQDAYLDCPTREQRAWLGDAVVHQGVDLMTNPDWGLAGWHPRLCAAPRPDGMLPMAVACDYELPGSGYIPDWSLHWVRSVRNLHRWTGDAEVVRPLLDVAVRVLGWFDRFRRGGLLHDVTGWVLLDWASVQGRGAGAVLNGLYGRALRDVAEIARDLGSPVHAAWCERRHAELRSAYQVFWDDERGGYRDWMRDGDVQPARSEHATAAAVVGGLVPTRRRAAALRLLLDREHYVRRRWSFGVMPLRAAMGPPPPDWDVKTEIVAAEPFFRYVVHDAVAELGAAGALVGLCRDWVPLLDSGYDTWPEVWGAGSRCHGWSSTPSRDLPMYVLGVSPWWPGYESARIAPRLGDLASVAGAVPTPHGPIEVSVCGSDLEVSSPVPFVLDHAGHQGRYEAGTWAGSASLRRVRA